MAILLPRSLFLHVPKTGGTWVREVLDVSGLMRGETICMNNGEPFRRSGANHCFFQTVPESLLHNRFTFAFVRHPLTWYQSYWAYRMETEWSNSADQVRSYNFNEYIRMRVKYLPGFLSRYYRKYCEREDGIRLSFIGQYEHLTSGLIRALSEADESFSVSTIVSIAQNNAASSLSHWASRCVYEPETAQMVLDTEREAIEQYGYADMDVSHILNAHEEIERYAMRY